MFINASERIPERFSARRARKAQEREKGGESAESLESVGNAVRNDTQQQKQEDKQTQGAGLDLTV